MVNISLTPVQAAWLLAQMENISQSVLYTSNEPLDDAGVSVEMIDLVDGDVRYFDSKNGADAEWSLRIGDKLRAALNEQTVTVTLNVQAADYAWQILRKEAECIGPAIKGLDDPVDVLHHAYLRRVESAIYESIVWTDQTVAKP